MEHTKAYWSQNDRAVSHRAKTSIENQNLVTLNPADWSESVKKKNIFKVSGGIGVTEVHIYDLNASFCSC